MGVSSFGPIIEPAALYDTLYPVVARALQKILHETSDYEDLVQTSFELILRTLQKPREREIENLAAWASAIATRVALDSLRSRIRERKILNRADGDPERAALKVAGPSLEKQLEVRRHLEWLQGVLARMNADQAETVVLHDVLEYDLKAVAELTGVSPAAAQKRLSRGHQELKRHAARRGSGGSQ